MEKDILENVAEILDSGKNTDEPATSEVVVETSTGEEIAKEVKEEVIDTAPEQPAEEVKEESAIDVAELAKQVKDLKDLAAKLQASDTEFTQSIETLKKEMTKLFFDGSSAPVAEPEKINVADVFDDEFIKNL